MNTGMKLGLAAAFIGAMGFGAYRVGHPYGEGAMAGMVTGISDEPQQCRMWKGEITPMIGAPVAFSVDNAQIVQQLKDAQASMKPAVLRFADYGSKSPCTANTGLRVTAVEPS